MKNSERISLTKRRLREAFLTLRKRKSLEQIRVTDLCRMAETNRTTFYHYYEDVYSLNDAVENQILSDCMEQFTYRGTIYSDPKTFLLEFRKSLYSRFEKLKIVGHDREDELYSKIVSLLVKLARLNDDDVDEEFLLNFIIGGLLHLMKLNRKTKHYSEEVVSDQMLKLLQHSLKLREESQSKSNLSF